MPHIDQTEVVLVGSEALIQEVNMAIQRRKGPMKPGHSVC